MACLSAAEAISVNPKFVGPPILHREVDRRSGHLLTSVHDDELVVAGGLGNELDEVDFLLLGDALDVERKFSAERRRDRHVEFRESGVGPFDPEADDLVDQVDAVALDADDLHLRRVVAEALERRPDDRPHVLQDVDLEGPGSSEIESVDETASSLCHGNIRRNSHQKENIRLSKEID